MSDDNKFEQYLVHSLHDLLAKAKSESDCPIDAIIGEAVSSIMGEAQSIYESNMGCPICGNERYRDE